MQESKPVVVLITKNLPPDLGGMEKLWWEAIKELTKQCTLYVIGPKAAKPYLQEHCIFLSTPKFLPFLLILSILRTLSIAIKHKPTAILAGSGVTLLPTLFSGLITKTRTYAYLHGLDIIYPSWLYQTCFKFLAPHIDQVFTNSESTCNLAINAGVNAEQISIIHPATTPLSKPNQIAAEYQINKSYKNLIFFGRLVKRKGLLEFLKNSFAQLCQEDSNYHLHIIGDIPHSEKTKKNNYLEEIRRAINDLAISERVTLWGPLPDEALVQILSQCNAHIFPLLDVADDTEGFGIVIIEADSLGIPTVAFDCGGARDALTYCNYGKLIESNNYIDFTAAVVTTCTNQEENNNLNCEPKEPYNWQTFSQKLYSQLIRA
ncbi:glycosyltransferase family 4 protein [Halioxenophilus sp. WMMB6]|uniref:glycosyltransferase family 4 protein n=1 Tax=Halioxenophilus sp. WMMB6 TaxID=3073815 RepID=UPI00295EE4F5|nr:glycosyltransferase family 4 protein [Halioxenophilus sp. WMMB6]